MSNEAVELESEVILRVPSEAAKTVRKLIQSNVKDQIFIKLENNIRVGEVVIGNHHLQAKVVDLPTVIEGQKTIDNKTIYKTGDICQMILCKENVSSDEEDENLKANRSKETVQVNKKYLWPHGITPPMKNVRKRRFRKTLKNPFADTSEIEKEVKYLLKSDYEASNVRWEIIDESEVKNRNIKNEPLIHGEMKNTDVAERDIFGEDLSESDEDFGDINVEDIDEDGSRLSTDDNHLSDTDSFREIKPSTSGTQNLVTEFSNEMFDNSISYELKFETLKKKKTFDHNAGESNCSSDSDGSFISVTPLSSTTDMSENNIQFKITELKKEIGELKIRREEQDDIITSIENMNLKERFIIASNNLLSMQLEKEQQLFDLSQILNN